MADNVLAARPVRQFFGFRIAIFDAIKNGMASKRDPFEQFHCVGFEQSSLAEFSPLGVSSVIRQRRRRPRKRIHARYNSDPDCPAHDDRANRCLCILLGSVTCCFFVQTAMVQRKILILPFFHQNLTGLFCAGSGLNRTVRRPMKLRSMDGRKRREIRVVPPNAAMSCWRLLHVVNIKPGSCGSPRLKTN